MCIFQPFRVHLCACASCSSIVPHLAGKTPREMTALLEAEHARVLTMLSRWRDAENIGDDDDESPPP